MTTDYPGVIAAMRPGSVYSVKDLPWEEYEQLLEELGEGYAVRIFYDRGRMEIIAPALAVSRAFPFPSADTLNEFPALGLREGESAAAHGDGLRVGRRGRQTCGIDEFLFEHRIFLSSRLLCCGGCINGNGTHRQSGNQRQLNHWFHFFLLRLAMERG
jgi:hypothetical protein